MPALWLLASYAVVLVGRRPKWIAAGIAAVVVMPFIGIVRLDWEWSQLDTRIVAKQWIEANVPVGAKILMDGSQYRFVQSPPISPDEATLVRRLARAEDAHGLVSRGLSSQTLDIYSEAIRTVAGPRYNLHSTVWGLAVQDPEATVRKGFEYVITSSMITENVRRERFPASARFYDQLRTDPRFRPVYSVKPIAWQRSGPTIVVYQVINTWDLAQSPSREP